MALKQFLINLVAKKILKEILKGGKMKTGVMTSEFWLSLASIAASIWFAVNGMIPAELTIKIVAVVTGVYAIARAVVKLTPSTKDDELIKKIEELFQKKTPA